jgi:hypothetical protein
MVGSEIGRHRDGVFGVGRCAPNRALPIALAAAVDGPLARAGRDGLAPAPEHGRHPRLVPARPPPLQLAPEPAAGEPADGAAEPVR